MSDDNVVNFPKRRYVPSKDQIADVADRTGSIFSSLAMMAEITARVLKAVAHELSRETRQRSKEDR